MTHFERPEIVASCLCGGSRQPPPPSLFVTFTSDWNVTLRLGPATSQPASQRQPATNTENKKWSHSAKQDSCIEDSRQLRLGRRSSLQYRFLIKLSSHSVSVNLHEIVAAWDGAGDHWPPSLGLWNYFFRSHISSWHFYNCGLQTQLWL